MIPSFRRGLIAALSGLILLSGCTAFRNDFERIDDKLAYGTDTEAHPTKVDDKPGYWKRKHKINGYMWRASLAQVSTLPLIVSDPAAGQIETDWYSAPDNPDERRKIRIAVLGDYVRRDMLRVTVDRQLRNGSGWADAPTPQAVAQKYEDNILTDAKDIRDR